MSFGGKRYLFFKKNLPGPRYNGDRFFVFYDYKIHVGIVSKEESKNFKPIGKWVHPRYLSNKTGPSLHCLRTGNKTYYIHGKRYSRKQWERIVFPPQPTKN